MGTVPVSVLRIAGLLVSRYNRQWTRGRRELILPWNRANQAIFIHIPKTAGTSLLNALEVERPADFLTHVPAEVYREVDPDLWKKSFRFTVVRDPLDRFASAFHFLRDKTTWNRQVQWRDRHIRSRSFAEFIRRMQRNPLFCNEVLAEPFFWPQVDYLKGHLQDMHKVYRFEDLAQGVLEASNRLGLRPPRALPHDRKCARPPIGELYDENLARFVEHLYRKDYAAFGYVRGGWQPERRTTRLAAALGWSGPTRQLVTPAE